MIFEFVMRHVCVINPDSLSTTAKLSKKCKSTCTDQKWKPVGSIGTGRVAGRVEIIRPADQAG